MTISIYLIIAIICAVFLIVSIALGGFGDDFDMGGHDLDVGGDFDAGGVDVDTTFDAGHGDFSGAGISPLSLPIIMAFGTTFGGVGALLEEAGFDRFVTPIIAIFVSIIMAAVLYFALSYLFIKTQATSSVVMRDLIGEQGTISVAIKPGKIGQVVVVTEERGRTLLSAVADGPIPQDAAVEITALVGNGVKVERK